MAVKILYVEDELFLAKIVKESLESRAYEVLMEADGDKAFPLFKQHRPDICVLDVMLPNKDGFAIAEEIRGMDAQVPIIFLTAKAQTEDLVKGFKTGGNDYIRKPFSMEELIVRIENALRFRSGEKKPDDKKDVVKIGKYSFYPNHQVLKNNGDERKLSFRETELLKVLYENRDKIIDRRDILNLLWGNDNFFNSRNLDVYITKLRSYLKNDAALEIITIKGIGYRFVTD
ncbi:MAG TPA: response regulator transcription factor [Ferruginibacter sp.]|nr:response regulator transcription factor [Chitinophagaceae bacterium]MBP6287058.1 response regulator transcription factor [Ferruginibacter sp.]HQY12874.1 response regulator transcription factor [Ferruginibacter sp.]